MVGTITTLLNQMEMMGIFAYVIPFLLIFAIIFAILEKTGILGDNRAVAAILSLSVALLSLQFDIVSTFFANIFPKFGVGIAIFLVLVILMGFFTKDDEDVRKKMGWIGWVLGIVIVLWAISNWSMWGIGTSPFLWQIQQYFGWILLVGVLVLAVVLVTKKQNGDQGK